MAKVQKMFLDRLIDYYSNLRVPQSQGRMGMSFGGEEPFEVSNPAQEAKDVLVELLGNRARLFLINGAVVDDLYNTPHDNTNYQAAMHLPFPVIFFELQDTLSIQVEKESRKNLQGMLIGNLTELDLWPSVTRHFLESELVKDSTDSFGIYLFYNEPSNGQIQFPDRIFFSPSSLPKFSFASRIVNCEYSPEKGIIHLPMVALWDAHQQSIVSYSDEKGFISKNYSEQTAKETPQILKENFEKLLDLCINIVDYINAHNAVIRKTTRNPPDLDKINRKRVHKGKKPLPILKPVYWVDIRQTQEDEQQGVDTGVTLPYREWVRGHFQHYHTKEGIVKNWIQPYVRGPKDAPWKENRYRVLDEMLRKGPAPQVSS